MSKVQDLWGYLGIGPTAAVAVVLATGTLFFAFIAVSRLWGQRIFASMSSFDLLVVIVIGAIIGRALLGSTPTLGGGLVAIVTLLALEGTIDQLSKRPRWQHLINNRAVLLMAGATVLHTELRRFHMTEAELRSRLRQAGIRNTDEVAAVVLESTGAISVLRRGVLLDLALLRDVSGAEQMPSDLLSG